ncbi:MAG: acyltransferase [Zavarzinella sp.]
MTEKSPAAATTFLPRLESLRGVAALLVALLHIGLMRILENNYTYGLADINRHRDSKFEWVLTHLWRALANGHGAVILFFVLSGFVLRLSLNRSEPVNSKKIGYFFLRRLIRLYPAVIGMTLIFVVLYFGWGLRLPWAPDEMYTWVNIVKTMTLLETRMNGVMWSLQLELIATPVIVLTFFLARQFGEWILLLLLFVLAGLSFTTTWDGLLLDTGFVTIGTIYAFLAGMAVPYFGKRAVEKLSSRVAVLAICWWTIIFFTARTSLGMGSKWSVLVEVIATFSIVSLLAYGKVDRVAFWLDWKLFRFYGKISYSFYLLHPVTFIFLHMQADYWNRQVSQGMPALVVAVILAVVSIVAITPISALMYYAVEKPFIRLGSRLRVANK